ncbi:YbfB/YjiJ family MFS transporter [Pigmentiphaga aceris]|uniref:YbfB/YjiJ family MFS transporter n=1 Tax=Pigmentiphaga aceris TaxID=1940612 RepID=A0A5C0AZR0_9BURK|nr:YbfB/YjiJ family MFS transporter [Pigmentiphaga aceris]QEI06913.1 YbfB/YjiJ family MFS transporter [Pigmentiphaga aceris]
MSTDRPTRTQPGTSHGVHQGADPLIPIWVVFGLAMGPAVALGLSRFAYALLLPAMRSDLAWSFADAGTMNTANAAGYLAGALVAATIGKQFGDKRVFALGLLLTAIAVGASGLTANFTLLLILRIAAGFTGALAFVTGAGLTSAAAAGGSASRAPTLLGIYFAGAGIAVTASALAVPPLLDNMGWRGGWMVLGALSLAATVLGWLALKRCPAPMHLSAGQPRGNWSLRFMTRGLIAYGLFGAGYIAYATFIVAFLRGEQGFTNANITIFWSILGLAAVAAAFFWGPVLGRLRGGQGIAATMSTVLVGAVVALVWPGPVGAYLSALLFGGSFLAVVASAAAFARKSAPPQSWTAAIGAMTIAFGLGQCIGPVLSGLLSDGPSGVRAGLWVSVGILMVGVMVAAWQPEPSSNITRKA